MGFYVTAWTALTMIFVLASCQTEEKPVVCSVVKELQSLHGKDGRDGRDGMPGHKGDPGIHGEMGIPGLKGIPGIPGKAGPQGQKGDQCDKGADGKPGEPGLKGEKGLFGPPGEKGDTGPPGAAGYTGAEGPAGRTGVAGTPGAKGDKGDPGEPGLKGEKGLIGPHGEKGDTGPPGAAGYTGAEGPAGRTGVAGTPGAKGDKGDRGTPASQDSEFTYQLQKMKDHITKLEKVLLLQEQMHYVNNKIIATDGKEVDFETSKATCEALGGSLATPKNDYENNAILKIVKKYNSYAYIGIQWGSYPRPRSFKYFNGYSLSYTNWYKNQPDGAGAEKCVEMYTDGTWNDLSCDYARLTICEF